MLKYPCLVLDHDDTTVNSTATVHYPCFVEYMAKYFPHIHLTLEEYFNYNFDPGVIELFTKICGMTWEEMLDEEKYWKQYASTHVPKAYPGIREIMERQKAAGGLVAAVSHSHITNILRDWAANALPVPDAVYGWERPENERKPAPFPLEDIMRRFSLEPKDLLVIDDLKPGYDMARSVGADFAAVGWANDIPEIERFMRAISRPWKNSTPFYDKAHFFRVET